MGVSSKSRTVTLLLCFFFGVVGAHRFYLGKTGSGLAQVLTLGGLGIWTTYDFLMIIVGKFSDDQGRLVEAWS